ncbi:MAG: bifunctional glutamate N-acetyltransferase/amino-acid acetyltransferase ArgJ [Oscillospiraceae bacterium]|nr:bifunctional glutamate N-acetyltransferase/amino-acid acetyltransferase ArgJ [Oscillospiraceae bacterium]
MVIKMTMFNEVKVIDDYSVKGFKAAGIHSGIRKNPNKKDLAMIYCEKKCNTAALFTTNKVKAAPITVSMANLADNRAQAVIVNSGNANACTPNGHEIARAMCELTAKSLEIDVQDVVVASTGVIGQELSVAPFVNGIPALVDSLSEIGFSDAANAIMTTDTFPKQSAVEFEIDGKTCRVAGFAKGSGMINPNMATMLAFIMTDVSISPELLKETLSIVNEDTFNAVSVDGDTSTNDMVCVMSSGLAGNTEIIGDGDDCQIFLRTLYTVMLNLAREIARDGEGATKLVGCIVSGAPNDSSAKSIAKSVVSSSLVKAALGAADANWGRILCAMGYAEGEFDVNQAEVAIGSVEKSITVCKNGTGVPFSEEEAYALLSESEIRIYIDLHSGEGHATAWGCDLTAEYVRINADYRS